MIFRPAAIGTKTVVELPDGSLLLSIGSSCDVCDGDDPRRAAISVVPPAGELSRV